MSELTELEEAMRSLKKDNAEKRRIASELESEKKYLEERNRFLIEKLKQAGVLYEESGRRLADFVEQNVKPLKAKMAEFEALAQRTKEYEKNISSSLKRVSDFEIVIGSFRKDMIANEQRQAAIAARLEEIRKTHADISARISKVQSFGSEELADKVEEVKAKFSEEARRIEDEFGGLKLGVAASIDNFRKEFERRANELGAEMEKVDIKKAKELGEGLARTTEELNKSRADFARSFTAVEKALEKLDASKTKELSRAIDLLSASLDDKFASLSASLDKRVLAAEGDLNRFRIELEKALGKSKADARDFLDSKSKEIASLLAELRAKTKSEAEATIAEWNKSLGALRSELLETKKEAETLIGVVDRKVEAGEERREKRLESSLAVLQASLSKQFEAEANEIYVHVAQARRGMEAAETEFAKRAELLGKTFETAELKRRKEIDGIIRDFASVRGQVDEKTRAVAVAIEKFSKTADVLRAQIVRESLAGVHERMKAIFEEMEKKFETVEDSLIDKLSSLENDFDELKAGFQGSMLSFRAETDREIDSVRKEFEKRDVSRNMESAASANSLKKEINGRFAVLEGGLDNRLKAFESDVGSLNKAMGSFTVQLSGKFDSVVQTKTKEFEKAVRSLVADVKSMERDVNAVIGAFRADIGKRELQKKGEIDRMLRDFVAARGRIEEKMLQVDAKVAEFSDIRKELKKEIYKESLAGVQERVKDIIAGVDERFNASREDMEAKIGELMKSSDMRIREAEANLNGFRIELEKTVGRLRADVDKVTGKKTTEVDRIAGGLKKALDERVEVINAELLGNFDETRKEVAGLKAELAKSVTFMRKEFEAGEARRAEKTEKLRAAIDREFRAKVSDLAAAIDSRVKANEAETRAIKAVLDGAMAGLKERFDEIMAERAAAFESSVQAAGERAEKAKKDVDAVAEGLKARFIAEEKGRRSETEKAFREMMVIKGELARRMKEIDAGMARFADARGSLKGELLEESASLIDSKLASFSEFKKGELAEAKKSSKSELADLRVMLEGLSEKISKLNEKSDALREDLYAVKRARGMLVDDVRAFGKTLEANTDAKLRTFMKDMERGFRSHEDMLNARMSALEKKIGSVSENASRAKKQKEEELDELLRHVES